VVVPNGKLWGEIVKVPSRNDTERVELKFTRPLDDDIETAIARVQEIVSHDKRVTEMAQIGVDTVTDINYVLVARMWVPRRQAMQVHFDINRAVKEEFQRRAPKREEARAAD
jgi:small conductance mechanosensitive channel